MIVESISSIGKKAKVIHFIWQHIWLIFSLNLMTLGVALCVRSCMGSSVISSLPLSFSLAGTDGLGPMPWTIGTYTYMMNFIFVVLQIAILRRQFEWVQLFQLAIGFIFGALIDVNMSLTAAIDCSTIPMQAFVQFLGCTVMGIGISLEVRCGSVTMPGEGLPVAISKVTGKPFPKMKIAVDTTLVAVAVISCYIFWGYWRGDIVGVGTLFAMGYVGWVVKMLNPYLGWFDRTLAYNPGFRRYIFGLARYIYKS